MSNLSAVGRVAQPTPVQATGMPDTAQWLQSSSHPECTPAHSHLLSLNVELNLRGLSSGHCTFSSYFSIFELLDI